MPRLQILHQVARLHRRGLRQAASDDVDHDATRRDERKEYLGKLAHACEPRRQTAGALGQPRSPLARCQGGQPACEPTGDGVEVGLAECADGEHGDQAGENGGEG